MSSSLEQPLAGLPTNMSPLDAPNANMPTPTLSVGSHSLAGLPSADTSATTSVQSPIQRGRTASQPTSPSAPRASQRERKPSAKAMEMAEAGPSRISAASQRGELKPEPAFLQPDHFCPLNNGAKPAASSRTRWEPIYPSQQDFLSPEDDPLALRGIPVFRPTMEEFQDFEGYVTRTVPWGMRSGIVKVIPPAEWTETLPAMSPEALSQVHIKSPIQQNMMGTAGIFRAQNIEKNKTRPLTVREWYDKCQSDKFIGPSPKTWDRDSREAQLARDELVREKKEKDAKRREQRKKRKEDKAIPTEAEPGPSHDPAKEEDIEMEAVALGAEPSVPPLDPPSSGSSHSSPDPPKTPEIEAVDDWYRTTDFKTAWLPKGTQPEDYTTEACAKLQEKYWKTMGLGEPSWYGADLMQGRSTRGTRILVTLTDSGSLFADVKTPWNVAHLPNLLDRINCVVPGVNEPYLYFGMWRATFAWHVEDMDLFSINYIHFGAPKFWYAIPQGQADYFERYLANEFPLDARECDQFIRHKSMAISPTKLKDAQTRVNMLVHNQGEFVITYPRGYHAGFNMGFNCAESVNFALDSWIEHGRKARHCKCVNYSVRIDVDKMLAEAADAVHQEEGYVPALREPKHPRSNEDAAGEGVEGEPPKPRKRPRKSKPAADAPFEERPAYMGTDATHIIALSASELPSVDDESPTVQPVAQPKKRAPLKQRKMQVVQEKPVFRCLFCPSQSTVDLWPVHEPSDFVRSHWKGRPGETIVAHLACAQSTPECYFKEEVVEGEERIWVMGVNDVVKDRWTKLKCRLCPTKELAVSGVKVQCTKGKCPIAFHYSCAKADDRLKTELWQVEEWHPQPIPEGAPEGTEPVLEKVTNVKLELLCQTHNPAQKEVKEQEKREELKRRILQLIPGQLVKIKSGSGSLEYKLVSVNEDESMLELEETTGRRFMSPWSRVDFRSNAPKLAENEYARHHTHSRYAGEPAGPAGAARPAASAADAAHSHTSLPVNSSGKIMPVPRPSQKNHAKSAGSAPASLMPFLTTPLPHQPLPPVHAVQDTRPSVLQPPRHIIYPSQQPPISNRVVCVNAGGSGYAPAYNPYQHTTYVTNYYPTAYPSYGYYGDMKGTYVTPAPPPMAAYPAQHLPSSYPYQPSSAHQAGPPVSYPTSIYSGPVPYQAPAYSNHSSGPVGMRHLLNPDPVAAPTSTAPLSTRSANPSLPSVGVGKIDLGLDRMQRVIREIGALHVPAIHLAGTNGKGSVSAMLESCLRAAKLKVGRYNSPHLLEPRDAIRLNGRALDADSYRRATAHVESVGKRIGVSLTSFEVATAAAYAIFIDYKPDVMIIECGMGGARDATNVIPPEYVLATALTSVGLDHTAFLGDTVEAITEEKTKIAAKDALFFMGNQTHRTVIDIALQVIQARGARGATVCPAVTAVPEQEKGTVYPGFVMPSMPILRFTLPDTRPDEPTHIDVRLPLPGKHQQDNAALAMSIIYHLSKDARAIHIQPKLADLNLDHIRLGIERAKWAGRCTWLDVRNDVHNHRPILVDGAHNADSAARLRAYIDTCLPAGGNVSFIVALSDSKGKTPDSVLQPLLRPGDSVAAVEFSHPVEGMPWIKPVPHQTVRSIVTDILGQGSVWLASEETEPLRSQAGLEGALAWARGKNQLTVVCGSLYLVADVYRFLGLQDTV